MPHPIEDVLLYRFQDPPLLEQALTHASVGHEKKSRLPHNERMEFLGDAVLQLAISEHLFAERPELPEGHLTKIRAHLVNRTSLAELARLIDLGAHLRLGKSELSHGGRARASNLANAMEAVIGAIFLDGGYPPARDFVLRLIGPRLGQLSENPEPGNAKGALQEKFQALGKKVAYRLVSETGPAHSRRFECVVEAEGSVLGTGSGPTKKEAEMKAAEEALRVFAS